MTTGDITEQRLQTLFRVDGIVAVVTGGGSGIGRMLARALALNGAHKVYILGRRHEVLKDCAASVHKGNIIPIVCDVTSKADLEAAASQVTSEVGYVNILCCNAGILGPMNQQIPSKGAALSEFVNAQWESSIDEHADVFRTNVSALWFNAIAFLELLDAGNKKKNVGWSSQIITTSSVGGFNRAPQGTFTYSQSKAAVNHMTKQLATTLIPYGIRANAIAPGVFPSDMASWMTDSKNVPRDRFPQGRFGDEEDMSGVILFLGSRAGAYVNGTVLVVDGGSLSILPATY
ncbi:hypothetical protein F5884DRAFT_859216 [Xylogone sp. PMI_703]|nr:hypothetical protein F5884DRAFT_859216 [Xylogone sp. PMI_703]